MRCPFCSSDSVPEDAAFCPICKHRLPPSRITEGIGHFTGRAWLLPELIRWTEGTDKRVFLLTGNMGTGKSMVAAWLNGAGPVPSHPESAALLGRIRQHVKAAHYCMYGTGSTDPRDLARSLAEQLGHGIREFGPALAATLEDRLQPNVEQRAETIMSGGTMIGMLFTDLNLGTIGGLASFNRAVRDPLKKLYERGYREPLVLIVDALDEALLFDESPTIVTLLARAHDLPKPVRILATTRDDPRVLKFFYDAEVFDLVDDAPEHDDDVGLHAFERLRSAGFDRHKCAWLAERISQAASGQFLYADLVITMLLPQLSADADWLGVQLPEGLAGIYHEFISRELGEDEDLWYDLYEPLLGLIAVAQGTGLEADVLGQMVGQDLRKPLRAAGQYLVGPKPEGPFRLCHKSFADYLLSDPDEADYHIDAAVMHRRIVEHYQRRYSGRWERLDDYGTSYLITHVLGADRDQLLGEPGLDDETREYARRFLAVHLKKAGRVQEVGRLAEHVLALYKNPAR